MEMGATNTFLVGESHIAMEQDAVDAINLGAQGEPAVGVYPNLNQLTGLVVPEDAGIESMEDLAGARLGHPGVDTGTTATVALMIQEIYGFDISEETDMRQGGFGALPALLQEGRVDAMVIVSPPYL